MSGLVHFFSYATGVSLELPVGFQRAAEDDVSATYAVLGEAPGPAGDVVDQVRVRVVGAFEPDADEVDRRDAVDGLAAGFAGVGGEVVSRTDGVVDEAPVSTVVLHRAAEGQWLHLTATAGEHRLLSLVASTGEESTLAAYDAAVASIRLIEL